MYISTRITPPLLTDKRHLFGLVFIIGTVFLSGCSSPTRHEKLADLGFSTPYMEGYQDGCQSKVTMAKTYKDGFRRDMERMYKEERYANGWNAGYEQCLVENTIFH